MTQTELAHALGLHQSQISRHVKNGMPMALEGARTWIRQNVRPIMKAPPRSAPRVKPDAAAQSDPGGDNFSNWRTRRERAAALQAEAVLAHQNGSLISVVDIRASFAKHTLAAKAILMNMAPRLASALAAETDGAVIESLITAEVERALNELVSSPLAETPRRP